MQVQPSAKFRGKSEEIKKRVPNVWGLIDLLNFLIGVPPPNTSPHRGLRPLTLDPPSCKTLAPPLTECLTVIEYHSYNSMGFPLPPKFFSQYPFIISPHFFILFAPLWLISSHHAALPCWAPAVLRPRISIQSAATLLSHIWQ